MRKVLVYKWEKVAGKSHYDKIKDFEGLFHQFGCDYEEFETGLGNFTTAIVEKRNGEVVNIEVALIKFLDK